MKHKRFRWLFAAMSFALAGLVCLQIFWLTNAVSLEKKKFSEQGRSAMIAATEKLESGEALTLLSDAFVPDEELPEKYTTDSVVVHTPGHQTIRVIKGNNFAPVPPALPKMPVPPAKAPSPPRSEESTSGL